MTAQKPDIGGMILHHTADSHVVELPFGLGEWRITQVGDWYWIVGGSLILVVWLSLNVIDSGVGRALRALHGSEIAATTIGIDTARYKARIFVVSAKIESPVNGIPGSTSPPT